MNSPSTTSVAPSTTSASTTTEAVHPLSYDQVDRLCGVLTEPVKLPPKDPGSNFPVLNISPAGIVKVVRQRLIERGIKVHDIRMNGSAASYCLCESHSEYLPELKFNDVDLIFGVSIEREYDFHVIKEEVLMSLLEFFPEESSKSRISSHLLEETYVRKMVLVVNHTSRWSLLSLGDERGTRSIELKFVSKIKRQFEFTVDSFQIFLDEYLTYGKCTADSPVSISAKFFPTVHAISVYGDYAEAMNHLNNRLIHTEAPEEIRGGGLLKYCTLLVNGFKPADEAQIERLEPYMCSRFFIDFPTVSQQYYKILKCVTTRFLSIREVSKCRNFLEILFKVVSSQARCLMESERQKTMSVILQISFQVGQPLLLPPAVPMYSYLPPPPPYVPLRIQTSGFHHNHHRHTNTFAVAHHRPFTPRFVSPHQHNRHGVPWSAVKQAPMAQVR